MRKSTFIIIILIVLALIGGGMYYFFYISNQQAGDGTTDPTNQGGFNPFSRNTVSPTPISNTPISTTTPNSTNQPTNTTIKLPKLRVLSETPVAGMSASTTKIRVSILASTTVNTTIVRFVDRGTGHIYQANDVNNVIEKISNVTLPKIYRAYWNKNVNSFVLQYLKDNNDNITNFFAELQSTASSTASTTSLFTIKGKYLPSTINQIAVSPAGDKIFTLNIEDGNGIGYISSFDDKNKVKILDTPMSQVNIDWPESTTLTITTKGSAVATGYAYRVDTKTARMEKVIGGLRGLSVKMSTDGKKVLYSTGTINNFSTKLLDLKSGTSTEVIFRTLADKCVWSTIRKNEMYCAVPVEIPEGLYPDDWYKGSVSFVDQIWHLDTTTGEVHLMANLLTLSKKLIDAEQLTLDPKENYLYFINKRDLSLWSLDLNQ